MIDSMIALDVGERRIGVAIAHAPARLAEPWGVVQHTTEAITRIQELLKQEKAAVLVVGLPRGLEGQETAQTKAVQAFVDQLKQVISVPIHLQDEALTSQLATEELEQRGIPYNKGAVDALAATYILRDWLSEQQE